MGTPAGAALGVALLALLALAGTGCSSGDDGGGTDDITYQPSSGDAPQAETYQPSGEAADSDAADSDTADSDTTTTSDAADTDTTTTTTTNDTDTTTTTNDTTTTTTTNDTDTTTTTTTQDTTASTRLEISQMEPDCDAQVADWADSYGQAFLGLPRLIIDPDALTLGEPGGGDPCASVRDAVRALCADLSSAAEEVDYIASLLTRFPKSLTAEQWAHAIDVMCAGGTASLTDPEPLEGTITFSDTYVAGVDIYAGNWVLLNAGEAASPNCTYEVRPSADAEPTSSGTGTAGRFTLALGEQVTVRSCGWWTVDRGDPLGTPATTFVANGVYTVGTDIAAGTWNRVGDQFDQCFYEIYPDGVTVGMFGGSRESAASPSFNILSADGAFTVDLLEGDRIRVSDKCGVWTLP